MIKLVVTQEVEAAGIAPAALVYQMVLTIASEEPLVSDLFFGHPGTSRPCVSCRTSVRRHRSSFGRKGAVAFSRWFLDLCHDLCITDRRPNDSSARGASCVEVNIKAAYQTRYALGYRQAAWHTSGIHHK